MFDMRHLVRLESVGWFKAPPHDHITPYRIAEHTEYIELMVGGTVFFDRGLSHTSFSLPEGQTAGGLESTYKSNLCP